MSIDPEDAIKGWAARVEEQTSRTIELSERLQQARASAESRHGDVVVTVDHSGGLADLHLTERTMRLSPSELRDVILTTSRRAQAKLAKEVSELVSGLYGAESDTASFIGGVYSQQFAAADDTEDRGRE